ncbi:FecR domain-containing protein [Acidobacteriia bacterium AH_259_A11_L15]|nr:FecR domain-containing protein [Acidobacteriia bacterium AH_259_A11_L15]
MGLVVLLVQLPLFGSGQPVGKVITRSGSSLLNGIDLHLETTVFSGDNVRTRAESFALVLLSHGDQVHLGPSSSATLLAADGRLLVRLDGGMILARSGRGQEISVTVQGLQIEPADLATYEVTSVGNTVIVASQEGTLTVRASNRSVVVPPGQMVKLVVTTTRPEGRIGSGAHNAVSIGDEAIIFIALVAVAGAIGAGFAIANNDDPEVLPVSPSGP